MTMPYIKLFSDNSTIVDMLSDEEAGRLLKALMHYSNDTEDDLPGQEKLVFAMFKAQFNRDAASYREYCDKQRDNGSKGGRPKKQVVSEDEVKNPAVFSETQKTLRVEKEKEEDKDEDKEINNTTTTNTGARAETPFGDVVIDEAQDYAQRYLTGLTMTHLEEVDSYAEIVGLDLTKHAIDEAVACGKRNWAYVRAILQGYITDKIKTVAEAEAKKAERKKVTTPQGKQVTAQLYNQRTYTEDELEDRTLMADILAEAAAI